MTKVSLDSNVLVYATLEPQSDKGRRARDVILRAAPRGVLAAQVLLEFVAVVRRRAPDLTAQAIAQAEAWTAIFATAPTTRLILPDALALVREHQFQVWDAVIATAVAQAGAETFFSEDLQDGSMLTGMRVVNPFACSEEELSGHLELHGPPG